MWIDQQKANWRTVPRWRAKQKHDDSHLQPEMYLFCCGQWGMSNKSFLEQVCRSALCYKTCFYFIFACAYTLRLLFLFEVTLCSAGFFTPFCRVPCPVWRYYWHLWMPLFIHKWLLTVGAISNAALQNSSVPQKGVFPLSYVLCELPGISVGTDLNLHCAVCNYVPNRQKLNFSMKALAWRIKHSPFSCCKSVFFTIQFSFKCGLECFNYFILLYLCSRTCRNNHLGCKEQTLITQPSKVTVLARLEGSEQWGHIFCSCKKENLCWLSRALFIYTEKIGPSGLLYNGFHKRQLSSVL